MINKKLTKYGSVAGLLASGLVAGGVLAGSMTANAATTASTAPAASTTAAGSAAPTNPNPGDLSKPQRSDETLLTGDTAAKVQAAALAKYPGATVQRVETDSDGVYEAHVVNGGKSLIVAVGKDFTVTGTTTMGQPPAGAPTTAG
jgi:Rieske Fe-S protein